MKYIRLVLTAEGFAYVDPKSFKSPNSTELHSLSDDPSIEELTEHNLYKLIEKPINLDVFQEKKTKSLEVDDEARTATRYFEIVEHPIQSVKAAVAFEMKTILDEIATFGINYRNIFADKSGEILEKSKIKPTINVEYMLELASKFVTDETVFLVDQDSYLLLGERLDADKFLTEFRKQTFDFLSEQGTCFSAANAALDGNDRDVLVACYKDLMSFRKTWLGE